MSSILTGGIVVVDITDSHSQSSFDHVDAPRLHVLQDIPYFVGCSAVAEADIEWSRARIREAGLFAFRKSGTDSHAQSSSDHVDAPRWHALPDMPQFVVCSAVAEADIEWSGPWLDSGRPDFSPSGKVARCRLIWRACRFAVSCVPLAQWLERWSDEPEAAGPSPAWDILPLVAVICLQPLHGMCATSTQSLSRSLSRSPEMSGDLAQMVERSLSMREALRSMPRFSIFSQMPLYWICSRC